MKISVIVPIYNSEDFLKKSLLSLFNQSYKNIEIILVDDGSTDLSGSICDEFAKKDDRFYVVHKDNGGVSSARNFGLDIASGDWIAFVDSDDYVEPDYLSLFCPSYSDFLIQGGHKEFGASKNENLILKTELVDISSNAEKLLDFENGYIFYPWGKLFRADIIKKHHIRFNTNMRLSEDFCFVLEYLTHITEIKKVSNNLYHYHRITDFKRKYLMTAKDFNTHLDIYIKWIKRYEENFSCKVDKTLYHNEVIFFNCFRNRLEEIDNYASFKEDVSLLKWKKETLKGLFKITSFKTFLFDACILLFPQIAYSIIQKRKKTC